MKEKWRKFTAWFKKHTEKVSFLFKEREAKYTWNTWQAVLFQFLIAVGVCFAIEAMSRHSVVEAFDFANTHTKAFLYNSVLIYVTSLPVFLFRKRHFWRALIFGVWLVGGLANGIILSNRVTPLTGPDLKNVAEGLAVMTKYYEWSEIILMGVMALFAVIILLLYYFRSPKYKKKIHYIPAVIGICLSVGGFYGLTQYCINARILSTYFGNIAFAYEDYGFPYCVAVTLLDTGIDEPNNYSEELVEQVVATTESVGETTEDTDSLPNIIVIQLESFFDVSRVSWLETSEDPLEYWHSLCEEYSSGYYTVPSIGAGTANTEFETLTGMSLRFFGAGEYPFKGILKEVTCESAAFNLKELGYTATAIHNNQANFYSRKVVYKNLGFDAFISDEYMDTQDDVNENGWMRDENLITPIMDSLASTEGKDFVFTVSVQAHGAYPTDPVLEDPEITVSGAETDAQINAWEYYINQLNEVDQFIQDLIAEVEASGEDTVILFYGDHLPTMGLEDSDLTGGNTYQTNYLIWDNIGLDEQDKDIASYQAIAEVMDQLDIHTGTMFRFQQANNGTEDDFFADMQVLQYDLLYGEQYVYGGSENNPYQVNENYTLGIHTIAITDVVQISDTTWYVLGDYFTQSCKVLINGELYDPVFINSNTLMVEAEGLDEYTEWQIGVQSNSSTHRILSYSEVYAEAVLEEATADPSASPSAEP